MSTRVTFRLSDHEWENIATFSNLPAAARPLVEDAIATFRSFETVLRPTASETRKELKDLHKFAADFHWRMAKLVANPFAHAALTIVESQERFPRRVVEMRMAEHLRLASSLTILKALAEWLLIAGRRVPATKRGANRKALNVQWLVARLDVIREEFTGKKITRSNKRGATREYITAVCRIADPTIGPGTIDRAMQLRIRNNRRTR